jgi:AraC-like DNA-binding protein
MLAPANANMLILGHRVKRVQGAAKKYPSESSSVWIAPDFQIGLHHFTYTCDQYDGLPHTHGEYCMVMCLSGCMQVLRGDFLDLLSAGELLVVNPGEVHHCRFGIGDPHSEGLTLIVDRSMARNFLAEMAFPVFSPAMFPKIDGKIQDPEIVDLAHKLIGECTAQRRGFGIVVDALLRQMLVHILRHWPREAIAPMRFKLAPQLPWLHMHKAMEFMNAYGKGVFRLSDLCTEVGVSHSRFNPLFKNSAGTNPHSFYNHLLVLKARRLLQNEQRSIKDVAYTLGFKNVSHFCALFHKLTGSSPTSDPAPAGRSSGVAREIC